MVSKREHIDSVAKQTGQPIKVTANIIDAHLAAIADHLAAGESVILRGFGTFLLADRAKGPVPIFRPSVPLVNAVTEAAATAAESADGSDADAAKD